MARRRLVIGAMLAVVAAAAVAACGDGHTSRDAKVCDRCEIGADPDCFRACRDLCLPDDSSCDARCTAQCDDCRRDLVCGACVANCTGTTPRCAPSNETVTCDDGTYGGSLPSSPAAAP
jgi:hypothetical protein